MEYFRKERHGYNRWVHWVLILVVMEYFRKVSHASKIAYLQGVLILVVMEYFRKKSKDQKSNNETKS